MNDESIRFELKGSSTEFKNLKKRVEELERKMNLIYNPDFDKCKILGRIKNNEKL